MIIDNHDTKITDNIKRSVEKIFYRVPEAAEAISVSQSHMWGLVKQKIIPSYKTSDKVTLVKVKELCEYVESFRC